MRSFIWIMATGAFWLTSALAEIEQNEAENGNDDTPLNANMSAISIVGLNTKALKAGDPTPSLDASVPTLFGMRFCPWCERVALVAAKKGIQLRWVNINLREKPEWYVLKHPEGKVPALELEKRIVLDSALIPEFLDDYFPEQRVLPTDPFGKVAQKMLASKLEQIMPKAFYPLIDVLKEPTSAESIQHEMREKLDDAEKVLKEQGLFYAGDEPGFADYLTVPFMERIFVLSHKENVTGLNTDDFPGNQRWPSLTRWFWKMSQLPEFEAVTQPLETHLQWFEGYSADKPDYDVGLKRTEGSQ